MKYNGSCHCQHKISYLLAFMRIFIQLLIIDVPQAKAAPSYDESDEWRQHHLESKAEYLLWSIKNTPEPIPLVTSGALSSKLPGAIGQLGTRVLMGDDFIDTHRQSGGRFTMISWFGRDKLFGIEANYLFLAPHRSQRISETSGLPGSSSLAVPIFDVSGFTSTSSPLPGESVYVLPGPFSDGPGFKGKFKLEIKNRVQGGEVNALFNIGDIGHLHVETLTGVRWLQFKEGLRFNVRTMGVSGASTAGQFFNSQDVFNTQNNFYGVQFGVRATYELSRFFTDVSPRVSVGDNHETVNIYGKSMTSNGTLFFPVHGFAARPISGGIFAQPNNIGHYGKNRFDVLPEINLTLGYHLMDHLSLLAGYQLMYLHQVIRPGDQLNRDINTTQTALADASRASGSGISSIGPMVPVDVFHGSSFWIQGVSLGVKWR